MNTCRKKVIYGYTESGTKKAASLQPLEILAQAGSNACLAFALGISASSWKWECGCTARGFKLILLRQNLATSKGRLITLLGVQGGKIILEDNIGRQDVEMFNKEAETIEYFYKKSYQFHNHELIKLSTLRRI